MLHPLTTITRTLAAGGSLVTDCDARRGEWAVTLRRPDGTVYTLSRGHYTLPPAPGLDWPERTRLAQLLTWQAQVGNPLRAAQDRIAGLWLATSAAPGDDALVNDTQEGTTRKALL